MNPAPTVGLFRISGVAALGIRLARTGTPGTYVYYHGCCMRKPKRLRPSNYRFRNFQRLLRLGESMQKSVEGCRA